MVLTKITEEVLLNWDNPHTFKKDCCMCALDLMGIPRKDAKELALIHKDAGMRPGEIKGYFSREYPVFNFIMDEYRIEDATSDTTISGIYNGLIPPGYGILIGFFRNDGSGHCVVLAKTDDSIPVLLDSQQHTSYLGHELIMKYVRDERIVRLHFLKSYNKFNSLPLVIQNSEVIISMDIDLKIATSIISSQVGPIRNRSERRNRRGHSGTVNKIKKR